MEQFVKAGITKHGLQRTLVFSSIKWTADTWQNPPHRVGVRIIENSGAEQESVRLRPSGKYRDKPLGPHSGVVFF